MNEITKQKLMTTKELAYALGVSSTTITNAARKIGMPIKNGVTTYYSESQATCIKRLIESSGARYLKDNLKVTIAKTELEIIQNYKKATEEYIEYLNVKNSELIAEKNVLSMKIEEDAPKVEFFNQVTDSSDCVDMGTVAKVLNFKNIGRTKLFEILRNNGILMSDNRPYQKYIDAGYFRVIESKFTTPSGETHINFKTVVYQSGIDFIRKAINKQFKNNLTNSTYMKNAIEDSASKIMGELA
ncbi:MAG: phage antirepressor KilAC domain-containing protein [archaeon]|nr:phage antirepressor KilAC domain-containing protein [archaeon]